MPGSIALTSLGSSLASPWPGVSGWDYPVTFEGLFCLSLVHQCPEQLLVQREVLSKCKISNNLVDDHLVPVGSA